MHKLDEDTMITPDLLRAFLGYAEEESGDGRYYAVMQRSNGDFLEHNPGSPELEIMQKQFARDVVDRGNRELAHDGAWFVIFTHPGRLAHALQSDMEYARFLVVWMDGDGDIKFRIEWEAGQTDDLLTFPDVVLAGWHSQLTTMEMAWQQWQMLNVQALAMKQGQSYKKAKGERPIGRPH